MSDAATPSSAPAPAAPAGTNDGSGNSNQESKLSQESVQTPAEKRRIKIDNQELDEEDVIRGFKKAKGADELFRTAAQKEKATKAFMRALQEDPESVLSDPRLPIDKQKLALKWLGQQVEEELLDPKEKEARELKNKLKKYEDQELTVKEQAEQAQYQKVVDAKRNEIGSILSKAMELSPLSKDPDTAAATLREMASYLRSCKQQGWNPDPKDIAEHVASSKVSTLKKLAESMSVQDLISTFGKEFVQKLHKHALTELQASRQKPQPQVSQDWVPRESGKKREFTDPMAAIKNAKR